MIRQLVIGVAIFFAGFGMFAQDNVLEQYIKTGLENNIALQQKLDDYRKSILILKEAKGLFYPSISVNARYSVADGGRVIEFPVGDMLNPVYNNLNYINNLAALDFPEYPEIENQTFNFYRSREHDTKLELVQPLFNPEIFYNKKIKKEMAGMKKADAQAYKRHLVAAIKNAYYEYNMTLEMLKLLENTKELLEENKRINSLLYKQQKVTIDHVYRSESEISKLEQDIAEAVKNKNVARSYFNFLLNRGLQEEITPRETIYVKPQAFEADTSSERALREREEIDRLEHGIDMSDRYLSLKRSGRLPTITAVVDYGYQGEEYRFTGEYDYVLASVVLRWDLFKGLQNHQQVQQAKIDQEMMKDRMEETKKKIQLQVVQSFYDMKASYSKIQAARKQVESTEEVYRIVKKKYGAGKAPQIELINARTSMTNAGQQLIIAKYEYLSKVADFEKAAALYEIPDNEIDK